MNKWRTFSAFYLVRVLTPIDFFPVSFMTAFHVTFLTPIAPYMYSMFSHADIYEGAFIFLVRIFHYNKIIITVVQKVLQPANLQGCLFRNRITF